MNLRRVLILTNTVSDKPSHESSISSHHITFELNKYRVSVNGERKWRFSSTFFVVHHGFSSAKSSLMMKRSETVNGTIKGNKTIPIPPPPPQKKKKIKIEKV